VQTILDPLFNDSAYKGLDIYICATVVHTARLCLSLKDSGDVKTLQESFNDCLQCLKKYEIYGLPAKRCRTALQMLERRAFPIRTRESTRRRNIVKRSKPTDRSDAIAEYTSRSQKQQLLPQINDPQNIQQSDIDLLLNGSSSIAYPLTYNGIDVGLPGMDSDGLFFDHTYAIWGDFPGTMPLPSAEIQN
jgi:hypothetical protein